MDPTPTPHLLDLIRTFLVAASPYLGILIWEAIAGASKRIPANSTLGLAWWAMRTVGAAVADARRKAGPSLVLVFVLGAAAASCGPSAKVIAMTSTVATVDGLTAAVEAYTEAANTAEARIAMDALRVCVTDVSPRPTKAKARTCLDRELAGRRAAWDQADKAVAAYREAVALGPVASVVIQVLLNALANVGLKVNLAPGT